MTGSGSLKSRFIWTVVPLPVLALLGFGIVAVNGLKAELLSRSRNSQALALDAMVTAIEVTVAATESVGLAYIDRQGAGVTGSAGEAAMARELGEILGEGFQVVIFGGHGEVTAAFPAEAMSVSTGKGTSSGVEGPRGTRRTFCNQERKGLPCVLLPLPGGAAGRQWVGITINPATWSASLNSLMGDRYRVLMGIFPSDLNLHSVVIADGRKRPGVRLTDLRRLTASNAEVQLDDGDYLAASRDLTLLPARVRIAQPLDELLGFWRLISAILAGTATVMALGMAALALHLASVVRRPFKSLGEVTTAVAAGRFDVRAELGTFAEADTVARSTNLMTDTIRTNNRRLRVTYRTVMELFSCTDVDELARKMVEIACTLCQADLAWFEPVERATSVPFGSEVVHLGLRGWLWKNHRTVEFDTPDQPAWKRVDGDRVFAFMVKAKGQEVGIINVAYRTQPDDQTESLLTTVVSLVELAVHRLEHSRRTARIAVEVELASKIQKANLADGAKYQGMPAVAHQFIPATRLGGDWFAVIPDGKNRLTHVVMGDVSGQGVMQGLVTMATRGAIEAMRRTIQAGGAATPADPADIVALLDAVVRQVADPRDLGMSCIAVTYDVDARTLRICNAGHTFPMIVRDNGEGGLSVEPLHTLQEPQIAEPGSKPERRWRESTHGVMPGDYLIFYSDGLSEARNLKSEIFGRFMMRGLRRLTRPESAEALRDQIVSMFRYYIQDGYINDDVCFIVLEVPVEQAATGALPSATGF